MKARLVLAAVVAGLVAMSAAPSHAWVRKCTEEFRDSVDVRAYVMCLV